MGVEVKSEAGIAPGGGRIGFNVAECERANAAKAKKVE